ncbi:prepilin-type N-terminal cleavage/methylation domain-containing protein [Rheinheimera soli]|uniref:prepilin-type N-terminal cleavage/methylation domain-containing protein n=1 Tax=Rheinheimera soli TaxID=443616 RepID=UPI001E381506|nr:prepilin-type N-terminal cleavage/methylation domain-containing protein [Rheinheimera soli]
MPDRASGFTLIELIIVVILLGIISVTALPRFLGKSGVEEATVQDQMISILRRMQTQAMQQTNSIFLDTEDAAQRITRCHQLILTSTQLGRPDVNPCLSDPASFPAAGVPALTATAAESSLNFRLPAGTNIIFSIYDSATGPGNVLSLPFLFRFNSLGQAVNNSRVRFPNGLRIQISDAMTYSICIESEGYIHPC